MHAPRHARQPLPLHAITQRTCCRHPATRVQRIILLQHLLAEPVIWLGVGAAKAPNLQGLWAKHLMAAAAEAMDARLSAIAQHAVAAAAAMFGLRLACTEHSKCTNVHMNADGTAMYFNRAPGH